MHLGRWTIGVTVAVWAAAVGSASAADLIRKAPATLVYEPGGPSINAFGGFAGGPDSWFMNAGAVYALNRNLNLPGWLVRLHGGAGSYEYNRRVGLVQTVNFESVDAMVGYQTFFGAARLTGYVGVNVENHNNDDPLATVKGTETGVKVQGEIFAPLNDQAYLFALGTYSSAFNTYFVIGKAGLRVFGPASIGPEVIALGNDRFDAVRAGPFLAVDMGRSVQLIFSGGYSWDQRADSLNDHSGGYGTVHVRGNL
jgi:hypothetical protein